MLIETTVDIDLAELLGPLLVAEVEAYLATAAARQQPSTPAPRAAALPGPAWYRIAQHLQADPTPVPPAAAPAGPWWDGYPTPAPTLVDRLLRRRPTVAVTARQHLQLMDRYIAAHGWTQGQLWDDDGRVCVLGAHIRVLAAGYGDASTAWQARLLIGNALGYQGTPEPVDTWNDQPGTTQHDVHTLLRAAAAVADPHPAERHSAPIRTDMTMDITPRDRRQMIDSLQAEFGLSITTAGRLVAIGAEAEAVGRCPREAVNQVVGKALDRGEEWAREVDAASAAWIRDHT